MELWRVKWIVITAIIIMFLYLIGDVFITIEDEKITVTSHQLNQWPVKNQSFYQEIGKNLEIEMSNNIDRRPTTVLLPNVCPQANI